MCAGVDIGGLGDVAAIVSGSEKLGEWGRHGGTKPNLEGLEMHLAGNKSVMGLGKPENAGFAVWETPLKGKYRHSFWSMLGSNAKRMQ